MNNKITHHRLKFHNTYTHLNTSGVFAFFGVIILIGVPSAIIKLLVSSCFFIFSILSYQILKTTKPIVISGNSICLGKMVNGFKNTIINSKEILSIALIFDINKETQPNAIFSEGEVEVHSNYYCITLRDEQIIKFENFYSDTMKDDLILWGKENNVNFDLKMQG